jgi:8-amino-7-oxononanoate synthase
MRDEPERIERLWKNARFMKQRLDALGFDTGASQSPVIPIVIGNLERCFKVWRWLHDQGIFVNPVVPPAVPPGRALVRISLTAGHTRQQLSWALDKLAEVGRKFGLLG